MQPPTFDATRQYEVAQLLESIAALAPMAPLAPLDPSALPAVSRPPLGVVAGMPPPSPPMLATPPQGPTATPLPPGYFEGPGSLADSWLQVGGGGMQKRSEHAINTDPSWLTRATSSPEKQKPISPEWQRLRTFMKLDPPMAGDSAAGAYLLSLVKEGGGSQAESTTQGQRDCKQLDQGILEASLHTDGVSYVHVDGEWIPASAKYYCLHCKVFGNQMQAHIASGRHHRKREAGRAHGRRGRAGDVPSSLPAPAAPPLPWRLLWAQDRAQ